MTHLTKTIKAWIQIDDMARFKPLVLWEKPTPKEKKIAEDWGNKIHPCEIIINDKEDL